MNDRARARRSVVDHLRQGEHRRLARPCAQGHGVQAQSMGQLCERRPRGCGPATERPRHLRVTRGGRGRAGFEPSPSVVHTRPRSLGPVGEGPGRVLGLGGKDAPSAPTCLSQQRAHPCHFVVVDAHFAASSSAFRAHARRPEAPLNSRRARASMYAALKRSALPFRAARRPPLFLVSGFAFCDRRRVDYPPDYPLHFPANSVKFGDIARSEDGTQVALHHAHVLGEGVDPLRIEHGEHGALDAGGEPLAQRVRLGPRRRAVERRRGGELHAPVVVTPPQTWPIFQPSGSNVRLHAHRRGGEAVASWPAPGELPPRPPLARCCLVACSL